MLAGLHIADAILEQCDLHAAALRGGCFPFAGGGLDRGITQAQLIDAVDRNLVMDDQVTHHGIRQTLRLLDRGSAAARSEALNLYQVSFLVLHGFSQLVEGVPGVAAQYRDTRPEANFKLVGALVLIEIFDRLRDGVQLSIRLLGGVAGHLSAVRGIHRVLVSEAGVGVGALDSSRGARVNISSTCGNCPP